MDIYSANGELLVTLEDGVQYKLRFGNIAGISPTESESEEVETGVNRYLLVTTQVDESQFPVPAMRPIPNSVEELKATLAKENSSENTEEKAADPDQELTEEEWQERLEAEQEIITKENRRMMDERKNLLAEAKRRADELNQRFTDWYYVIPEETYSMLRIKRDQILANANGAGPVPPLRTAPQSGLPPPAIATILSQLTYLK